MPEPRKHLLGKVSELDAAGWKSYRAAGKDLIVVKTDDGLKGYVNFCTHMGGRLRCVGERLRCDRHGAEFTCGLGEAVPGTAAPAGSKLKPVDLEVSGDELYYVHKEEKSPWALD